MRNPEVLQTVYDGERLIGTLTKGRPLKGGFPGINAVDAAGNRIGIFPTRPMAVEALFGARRPGDYSKLKPI